MIRRRRHNPRVKRSASGRFVRRSNPKRAKRHVRRVNPIRRRRNPTRAQVRAVSAGWNAGLADHKVTKKLANVLRGRKAAATRKRNLAAKKARRTRRPARRVIRRRPAKLTVRRHRRYAGTLRTARMRRPYKRVTKRWVMAKAARKRSKRALYKRMHGARVGALSLHRRSYLHGKRGLTKTMRKKINKYGLKRVNPISFGWVPSQAVQAAMLVAGGGLVFIAGRKLAAYIQTNYGASVPAAIAPYTATIATGVVAVGGAMAMTALKVPAKYVIPFAVGGLAATLVDLLFFKHGADTQSLLTQWTKQDLLTISSVGDYALAGMGDYARMSGLAGGGVFNRSTLGGLLTAGNGGVESAAFVTDSVRDEGVLAGGIFD